ncbi:hypothetical protein [Streptomyces sp. Inha503]|uniref:hypothetical protein n=1 Tax=Streptomyces sp. Inha503 TaxID=3383314 RepID=UPI00399F3498
MKNRFTAAAIAVTVMAGSAACGGSTSSGGGSESSVPNASALKDAKGVTEITVWRRR